MNGYTMEDAEKIIGAAPVRVCGQCPSDPDYPALLEIYRRYIRGDHPMLLASSAFSLGHAIGVRDELARRSRARVDPPNLQAARRAEQTVERASRECEVRCLVNSLDVTQKEAVLSVLKSLEAGEGSKAAFQAGNAALQAAGHPPVVAG